MESDHIPVVMVDKNFVVCGDVVVVSNAAVVVVGGAVVVVGVVVRFRVVVGLAAGVKEYQNVGTSKIDLVLSVTARVRIFE